MKPTGLTGILYLRVSSDDQVRGVSLDDQEAAGREWFVRRGVELLEVFREEGKSGRETSRRVALRRALEFAERRVISEGKRLDFFLFYDLSRFARNLNDQLAAEHRLASLGVRINSVVMELTDDPHGRLNRNLQGAANQYQSELQGEKITRCMQETARRGGWPWPAPLGYRNVRLADGRKAVELDPQSAPLLQMAFELVARGKGTGPALARVTALGLRSRRGKRLRSQEFRKLIENPFYAGRVVSAVWSIDVAGKHAPLVTDSLWRSAQLGLTGMPHQPHQRERPEFPLRGFVRCDSCGHPLTASLSTGKAGTRYGYYRCWWRDCASVNVSAQRLEDDLVQAMRRIEIPGPAMRLVAEHVRDIWGEQAAGAERLRGAARRRISELLARREALVETFAVDRHIDRETYQRLRARIDADLTRAELEHRSTEVGSEDFEWMLRHASRVLTGASALWLEASVTQKRELQALLFPDGARYGAGVLRTPATHSIYGLLLAHEVGKADLVERMRSTWNTVHGFLIAATGLLRAPIGLQVGRAPAAPA